MTAAATGCPHAGAAPFPDPCPAGMSPDLAELARGFDPFVGAYQVDPAAALQWSRDRMPVFHAPGLGYWVVSRYDDIKAVFRDPILFSPRNVLEKITPATPEAQAVLQGYGFALNRTLVNEDEPAHMERRRVLLDHFLPANLEAHQDMIRRLTRERVDAFVDAGRVDLVDAMLYEVPLLVALHFLGVPEDEIATLRSFSLAHSVNTWGRPTPEKQIEVAHDVGRFWQYAGKVIEKMRAQPDGTGWMHHTIRLNAEMPDVVTDSYVHSMMMAIIVAAHETTSLAAANMVKTLLTHREAWDAVCADPGLIPNAVEECLRFAGSIVAWRRQTTAPTELGGVALPEGAKLLIVQASGNQDSRQFEDGARFDIFRDNAVDHLTFGYGAHQCMGKNIGRMELRIILEELSRRLPHLRLAAQDFSYMPNTSFRGPEHLWVEWDPARNPERTDPAALTPRACFAVGAPDRKAIARPVRVSALRPLAEGVLGVTLSDPSGAPLPDWSPGAHVEIIDAGFERKYSLCGRPGGGHSGGGAGAGVPGYELAILREDDGRGGSLHFHQTLREGAMLRLRGPHNLFRLDAAAPQYLLIAGGIGITPILTMADRLRAQGRGYALHYAGRARAAMALLDRAQADHGAALHLYPGDEGARADLAALVATLPPGGQIYACGPARMIAALEGLTAALPEGTLRVEHFTADQTARDPARDLPFEAELRYSGLVVPVAAGATLLEALRAAGVDVASDCGEGLCGSCEVGVLSGAIDHRDRVLTRGERAAGGRMMACCSRGGPGARITLAL